MRILKFIGFLILIIVIIAILYTFRNSLFNIITTTGSSISNTTSIINKTGQPIFISKEVNGIIKSSPIPINPANTLVFGSWKNTSQRICGQEQANFGLTGTSLLNVLYNGYYVPIFVRVQALGNSAPNLISQKVYLSFVINNDENISTYAPYIVKSMVIKNNIEYWNFTFDGSTSNAINSFFNNSTANITESYLNGIVLSNHTLFISPLNPDIPYTAPNC